ncbi:MAG: NAD(P)-dependent oxidoreductase [Pseudomonadota bacterium]
MKVLLTGPSGRVGYTTFSRLLGAGHEVRCFDTRKNFLSHPSGFNESIEHYWRNKGHEFEWVWGDIRNADDVRAAVVDDVDVVIHHAAMTLPSHCEEEWEYCWEVNYYGTLNVIAAIQQSSKSPKLIYSSSVANYGFQLEGCDAFIESDPQPSTCTYAATKIASELAIRKSGINFTIMRMASAIDYRAPHLLMMSSADMQERAAKEMKLKTPTSPAHWVSVDDVNTAYLNAIANPASDHQTYNIAGPEDCRTSFKSFQDELSIALGAKTSSDSDWGKKPYPQHYYDISTADAVLDFAHTPLIKILKNMTDALADIGEFLELSQPDASC